MVIIFVGCASLIFFSVLLNLRDNKIKEWISIVSRHYEGTYLAPSQFSEKALLQMQMYDNEYGHVHSFKIVDSSGQVTGVPIYIVVETERQKGRYEEEWAIGRKVAHVHIEPL